MLWQPLIYKITQLLIIMLLGYILVKSGIVKTKDSLILSKLSLYLFMPAVIINAFNIDITPETVRNLMLAFLSAFLIHIVLLIIDALLKRLFKSTSAERASIMYSNVGNLLVPIVTCVLGEEWIIYSCAYLIVQIIFLFTHGVRLFSTAEKISIRKIVFNVNIITVFVCGVLLLTGIRLPPFVADITSSVGSMLAPSGMIIAGMVAAQIDFRKALGNKKIYFVVLLRLVICPLIVLVLVKGFLSVFDNCKEILLICYLASMTPAASTVMQFAQIYKQDEELSVMYNVATTLLCIVSMPVLVALF